MSEKKRMFDPFDDVSVGESSDTMAAPTDEAATNSNGGRGAKDTGSKAGPDKGSAPKKKALPKKRPPSKDKTPPNVPSVRRSAPQRYKVMNNVTVSWGYQMVRMRPPMIVSEASHGPGAIERLRNAGVALEEIEE